MSVAKSVQRTLQERAEALPVVWPDVPALVDRGKLAARARRRRHVVVVASAAAVIAVLAVAFRLADPAPEVAPAEPPERGGLSQLPVDVVVAEVEGWPGDYAAIDPGTDRMYLLPGNRATLAVVDTISGALLDEVDLGAPNTGENGLALDASRDLLYVASGDREQPRIAVVSTNTNQVVDTIEVGPNPPLDVRLGEVVLDSRTGNLLVEYQVSLVQKPGKGMVALLDTDDRLVVAEAQLGEMVRSLALDEARENLYAAGSSDSGQLSVLDSRTLQVIDTIDDVGPTGCLTFDPTSDLVLLCNEAEGKVSVIDAQTHAILDEVDVGGLGPLGVAVDSQRGVAYSADKVIDLETLTVVGQLRPTLPGLTNLEPFAGDPSAQTLVAIAQRQDQTVTLTFPPPTP